MKVKDVWLGIFIFLLVIFFGLYFSSKTGYYETEEKNKTILTLEQIKAFETDVQNGAEIDLKEYLKTFEKDYDNTISSSSLHLSNWIGKTIKDVLNNAIKSLAKMVS